MKKKYRLTARADESLQEIYRYTYFTFGPRQADKYLLELESAFERIADFPDIGSAYMAGKTDKLNALAV